MLSKIGDAFDGAAVHFGIQRLPMGILSVTYARIDPERMAIFQRDYGSEAMNPGLVKLITLDGDDLMTSEQMFGSERAFQRTHLYNEVIAPQGLGRFAQVTLVRGAEHIVPFVVTRRAESNGFGQDELAFLDALLPHLRQAMRLQLRLGEQDARDGALTASLDRMAMGVVMVDAQARILFRNHAAEAILRAGDGLTARAGHVAASSHRDTKRLEALIAATVTTAAGQGADPSGSLALARPSMRRPLTLVASPLAAGAFADAPGGPAALLFVADPETHAAPEESLLVGLYGLTAAEAALTARLAEGLDLGEVAASLGIAMSTARFHLARILAKTGTRRQAELLRLILRGPAGLSFRGG